MPVGFETRYLRFTTTRVQAKVWDSTQDFPVEVLQICKAQNREEEDMKNQKQFVMLKPY